MNLAAKVRKYFLSTSISMTFFHEKYKIHKKSPSFFECDQVKVLVKHKKASEIFRNLRLLNERRRLPTLPHCIAVPSAQVGLTSLFGMGRGGTPPQ